MLGKFAGFLNTIRVPLRLACITPSGWPVVLSLWYLYQEGLLFCATPESAKVVSYLRATPRCAFEIASEAPPYCGIRGQGRVSLLPELALDFDLLPRLLTRYLGDLDNTLSRNLLARRSGETALVIEPVQIYSWDFTSRMRDVVAPPSGKVCPS